MNKDQDLPQKEDQLAQFYYKKSRLQQLKGFCYTYQEGTIAGAAKRMGLLATAVTMQIQSLERDLGVKLFTKVKNRLKPTENGTRFYNMTIPIIQQVDGLFENFLSTSEENSKIHIAGHSTALSHILPKYIKKTLIQTNNKIEFFLDNCVKYEGYKKLIAGDADIAIYPHDMQEFIPEEMQCIKRFPYNLVLIMHRDYHLSKKNDKDITIKDIVENNMIVMDKKNVTAKTFLDILETYNLKSLIEMNNGNWEIVKNLVRENIGFSAMSSTYIEKEDKEIITKSVEHIFPDIHYNVFIKKNGYISKALQIFIDNLNS